MTELLFPGLSRAGRAVLAGAFVLLWSGATRADDAPAATIQMSAAPAGGSIGHLVQGVLRFRGSDYVLTLHGVRGPAKSKGSVYGLARTRDIEGIFRPSGGMLRNESGVAIRFDPELTLEAGKLEIEVTGGIQPKVSRGHRESGVD